MYGQEVPHIKFLRISVSRFVGKLRNSSDDNGCESIGSKSLNLWNKRGATGIHQHSCQEYTFYGYKFCSNMYSGKKKKSTSLCILHIILLRSYLTLCLPKSQLEIPNVLNALISEVASSFHILQLCGNQYSKCTPGYVCSLK